MITIMKIEYTVTFVINFVLKDIIKIIFIQELTQINSIKYKIQKFLFLL